MTRWVTHTHVGMGMGVNPYPPVYMGDLIGLFFCHEYGYGIVIPGGYLSITISIPKPFLQADSDRIRTWSCKT
jgi:hypothetical protein